MGLSLTELFLGIVGACVSVGIILWLTRDGRKVAGRIGGGLLLAVALIVTLASASGFLGYVLPVGQMDFWLASLLVP